MTRRQIQRFQCRVRRSVDGLYHSYIACVLRELNMHDQIGDVDRALASVPAQGNRACKPAKEPTSAIIVPHELKRHADLGCARARERLWQLQHVELSAA
jgi:hypothetical protein